MKGFLLLLEQQQDAYQATPKKSVGSDNCRVTVNLDQQ